MKTQNILVTVALVCSNYYGKSQQIFKKVFQNIYSGSSIQQTVDGGYIIAGFDNQSSTSNGFLLKMDSSLKILWSKTYGGVNWDGFESATQTSDGGYIAVGETQSFGFNNGKNDIYLLKTNAGGDTMWTKCYGGLNYDHANSVKQTPDGGFIIGGQTNNFNSAFIIKTNSNGEVLWTKTFEEEDITEVQNTLDSGYIGIGSYLRPTIFQDKGIGLFRMNSIGDTIWTKGYFGNLGSELIGKGVIQTPDGGFAFISSPESGTSDKTYLIKVDFKGDIVWTKGYSINGINFNLIKQTIDGGFIIGGVVLQSNQFQTLLIKTNLGGDTLWTRIFDLTGFSDIIQTNDGGFMFIGWNIGFWGGTYLIKIDSMGNSTCNNRFGSLSYITDTITIYSGTSIILWGGVVNSTLTDIGILDTSNANPCLPIPDICVVSVDSATQKNIVIWEKSLDTTFVDSYNVYKETTTSNEYALIGNVSNSSLSTFIDNSSTPAQKADRYKISTVDSTGIESYSKSIAHKSIHLSVNLGNPPQRNLIWDNYEGFTVSKYKIWRGKGTGITLIDSIQGSLTSYTDINPPANDTLYIIEALHPAGCNPTLKTNSYLSTKSNFAVVSNSSTVIELISNPIIKIYPDPSGNAATIEYQLPQGESKGEIEITNLMGQVVKKITIGNGQSAIGKMELDNTQLPAGTYFYQLQTGKGSVGVKKVIIIK